MRLQNWCFLLNFPLRPPHSWIDSTHHALKTEGHGRRIKIMPWEYWHPPLFGEGPLMSSLMAWKFAAFQSWSPSTQKPILNQECFSTILLIWEDLRIKFEINYKFCCIKVCFDIVRNTTKFHLEVFPSQRNSWKTLSIQDQLWGARLQMSCHPASHHRCLWIPSCNYYLFQIIRMLDIRLYV